MTFGAPTGLPVLVVPLAAAVAAVVPVDAGAVAAAVAADVVSRRASPAAAGVRASLEWAIAAVLVPTAATATPLAIARTRQLRRQRALVAELIIVMARVFAAKVSARSARGEICV